MHRQFLIAAFVLMSVMALATAAQACTRCVYLGPNNTVMVARSMDWVEDPGSEVWVFPRGMKRNGAAGPGSLDMDEPLRLGGRLLLRDRRRGRHQ
jgi:choloylglycine hydrolase